MSKIKDKGALTNFERSLIAIIAIMVFIVFVIWLLTGLVKPIDSCKFRCFIAGDLDKAVLEKNNCFCNVK